MRLTARAAAAPRCAGGDAMRGSSISLGALIVALAAGAPGVAFAACTSNVAGEHVFALAGDSCLAQPGTYNPVATGTTILPFNDPGFGFVAVSGGAVSTTGPATINTTGDGAAGLVVSGADSQIDATEVTISTKGGYDYASGLSAYGAVNAPLGNSTTGGTLNLTDAAITTAGAGNYGVYAGALSTTTYSGGAVATFGDGAHGLYVTGEGGSLTASGLTVSTSGAYAYAAYVDGGGELTLGQGTQLSTAGAWSNGLVVSGPGSVATVNGAVAIAATDANATGVSVDYGGAVVVNGALTVNAANGVAIYGAVEGGPAASFSAPGTLSLTTTSPSGVALLLDGDGATFSGTGGGTINAAGVGVAFSYGVDQSATFDNYRISSAGDLIYADPSTATVNFVNTTASAGAGNLANVADGGNLTVNAIASSLIGAFNTQAGAVSNLNLANGSNWTISGNSTVTNLVINNASAGFSAPGAGGFKTLTVNSYTGSNASLTLNAMLTGANPGADELVINGGQATGSTKIIINTLNNTLTASTATFAARPASASVGVPVVVTTNGGTISPGAFTLAGPVTAGGYVYSLQSESGGEYLVANQALTLGQASGSLSSLGQSRQAQAVTSRVLGSILLGATEQINCSACSSGFASFGSFAFGAHGRWTLSPNVELLAGASYDSYSAEGVTVNNSILAAMALRYDMVQLGRYRPFFEAGFAASPYAEVSYSRGYATAAGGGTGVGTTLSQSLAVYGRAGYVWRLSRVDEAAAYTDLTRSWQHSGSYLEGATGGNPFGALILPSLDTMNIWQIGGQYTHLFGQHVEANVSAGYAVAFGSNYGASASISGFGPASGVAPASFDWVALGGRLSYRFSRRLIADAFVLGTAGAEPAGNQIHGGLALRLEF
jgi:hypothetical protein